VARTAKARYIPVAAAARRLDRSPQTIRRWMNEGRLRGRQMSKPCGWREVSIRSIEVLEELARI